MRRVHCVQKVHYACAGRGGQLSDRVHNHLLQEPMSVRASARGHLQTQQSRVREHRRARPERTQNPVRRAEHNQVSAQVQLHERFSRVAPRRHRVGALFEPRGGRRVHAGPGRSPARLSVQVFTQPERARVPAEDQLGDGAVPAHTGRRQCGRGLPHSGLHLPRAVRVGGHRPIQ